MSSGVMPSEHFPRFSLSMGTWSSCLQSHLISIHDIPLRFIMQLPTAKSASGLSPGELVSGSLVRLHNPYVLVTD